MVQITINDYKWEQMGKKNYNTAYPKQNWVGTKLCIQKTPHRHIPRRAKLQNDIKVFIECFGVYQLLSENLLLSAFCLDFC